MTKTMEGPLTRAEARRLRELEQRMKAELNDLVLAGLGEGDRAEQIRDDLDVVEWRRQRDHEAHQEAERLKWKRKEEREAQEARRKARHEEAVAKAVPWLKEQLAQGPVVETDLFYRALLEDMYSEDLVVALEKLEAREVRPILGLRGRTLFNKGPRHWTLGAEGLVGGSWVTEQ